MNPFRIFALPAKRKLNLFALVLATLTSGTLAEEATELSQYGITWKFDRPYPVGRYVTGDYWVLGPAKIVSVTPEPSEGKNGSVVNPEAGDRQGYDHRISGYDSGMSAPFPLDLKPGQSLVSTSSLESENETTPETISSDKRSFLRTAAVLTCVREKPPADAFRPAYVGTWKKAFRASQVRRDILPRLSIPSERPAENFLARNVQRIWLDHQRDYVSRYMHPIENMQGYGRDITSMVSQVALFVLLDLPEKDRDPILLSFIQLGIDYYGVTQSDPDLWRANGGHNSGRKWPIIFAGLMLGQDYMTHVKATFQEDEQTYYGNGFNGQKALWQITASSVNSKHEEVDPATWATFGKGANNGLKAESYRAVNGPTWIGQALAARLMGATACWDHPAYFDYVDRWCTEKPLVAEKSFVGELWKTYRPKADGIGSETAAKRLETPPATR